MQHFINHPDLINHHEKLSHHTLYQNIKTLDHLKVFMESHVFAVWDFMSLLKRLQKEITCVEVPWRPSPYPKKVVRLINEIVLGEESDLGLDQNPIDHFSLYIRGMQEIGASSARLMTLMKDLDYSQCSPAEANFVKFNLGLAMNGKIHEVAAAFFFGREKVIPDMFTSILNDLEKNFGGVEKQKFSNLHYYLQRHIEVDGGEHSHLAEECLSALCGNDEMKWMEAKAAGVQSLILRSALWDEVLQRVCQKNSI
jgi:Protein of unknown function (DUF3050)